MNQLLQAKYDFIDRCRTLTVNTSEGQQRVEFSESEWTDTGDGCGHRAVALPFDEDFTLGVSWRNAGTERLDFDVPHTMELFVIRGRFDIRLGQGEWIPMAQGNTFILAPGQCHSMRFHERTYIISAICPPLPVSIPPIPDCHAR